MPIVTISRTSYSREKDVAEKVAQNLGFECISQEIFLEASEQFNVSELQVLRAIRDAPSALDRITFGKEKNIAYIQSALLEHFQKDNVVYHGLAGHYFVSGVSHVLKVRIIDEPEDRVKALMEREARFEQAAEAMRGITREGVTLPASHRGISKDKGLRILEDTDRRRRKWGLHLYGVDTHDPNLYDLVIHIKKFSTDDAAEIICLAARLDRFRATAESQQAMADLLLAARIKANLVERYPRVNVTASKGSAYIAIEGESSSEKKAIRDTVKQIPGVQEVEINVYPFLTPD